MIWQSEILLYNFQKLGIANQLWFSVLYSSRMSGPSKQAKHLADYHSNVRFYFNDAAHWRDYKAICKPFGVGKLLEDIPELGHCVFVMDPDIIFTKPIDFTPEMIRDDLIYGSDTTSYLSFNHFHKDRDVSIEHMTKLCHIVSPSCNIVEQYKSAADKHSVVGAQYLFKSVDAAFFFKIAKDSWNMYEYGLVIQKEGNQAQIWCMEMMAFLLNSIQRAGVDKVKTSKILDFNWATDNIDEYGKHPICHMAGVTNNSAQFNKQLYDQSPPWDPRMNDYSYITNTNTCAQRWLEWIQEYAMFRYAVRMITPA
ncbi:MAG: hypothetical protein EOP45_13040 [Sphingobacteriaceae bacterium]|nr:MAG: hypothetical protein EOP45_13040 [Sphingobacteriaceae bacterium]